MFRAPIPVDVRPRISDNLFSFSTSSIPQQAVSRLSMYVQAYTLYSSVRPFGVSTIVAGVDAAGPQLYVIEPSGVAYV